MADYDLIITACSPLVFSNHKPGGIFQESLPYVPGAVIRGALAELWLAANGGSHAHPTLTADCDFCTAFLDQASAIFTNAYPIQAERERPWVLPATAVACKNHKKPLFDTLIDKLCWERLAPPGLVYTPTCPVCNEPTANQEGISVQQGQAWRPRCVQQRLLTRVAINRRRNVAEEGMLYSPFVIDEVSPLDEERTCDPQRYAATRFRGSVCGLPTSLGALLNNIHHIGGSSSRGLGQVEIKVTEVGTRSQAEGGQAQSAETSVETRLHAFQDALQERWQAFAQWPGVSGPAQPDGCYFTLTLQADAVLSNQQGQPMMVYDAAMLLRQTGLAATLVASYAAYDYLGGWNAAWGLPKPTEVKTKMGSTYVYWTEAAVSAVVQALTQLEAQGIGRRRSEGYGQVRAVHEFHQVRR